MTEFVDPKSKIKEAQEPDYVAGVWSEVERRAPPDAAILLCKEDTQVIIQVLKKVRPRFARKILQGFPKDLRNRILPDLSQALSSQLPRDTPYKAGTIGRFMEPPVGLFKPDMSVQQAVEQLREEMKTSFITYGYVVDDENKLLGVVAMRELLLAFPTQRLDALMIENPFSLKPDLPKHEAVQKVLYRHYPIYPVCDDEGRLVGLLRGFTLFEEQIEEMAAQPGKMVGVQEEEVFSSPWKLSLRNRHPWLQVNLLTAFLAATVVGYFEDTIDQVVALAIFLPVLSGQSGNTGCQSLAIALRGMTLGELKSKHTPALITKEAWLGFLNGFIIGAVAGLAMYFVTTWQGNSSAFELGMVVFLAMGVSCMISGVSGAVVPLALKSLGADPATASSIIVTTATDVVSIFFLLGLATVFVL
jgi:magnesium transporter